MPTMYGFNDQILIDAKKDKKKRKVTIHLLLQNPSVFIVRIECYKSVYEFYELDKAIAKRDDMLANPMNYN